MLICVWLRVLLNVWVYFIDIASIIGALTDPLIVNITAKMTSDWFPIKDQVPAMTLVSLISILGPVAGSFYSLSFLHTEAEKFHHAKDQIFHGVLYMAVTYTIIYAIAFILYKEKPETPPGYIFIIINK